MHLGKSLMPIHADILRQLSNHERPLLVDLDGTLIYTNILHESVLSLLRDKPYIIFFIPYLVVKWESTFKAKNL